MSILDSHFLNWNILLNAETDFENIGEGMRKKKSCSGDVSFLLSS